MKTGSRWMTFRNLLARAARAIEPQPPAGEAWCVNCSLNGGRTLVIPVNRYGPHLQSHQGSKALIKMTQRITP
jgi:hypothetical protein